MEYVYAYAIGVHSSMNANWHYTFFRVRQRIGVYSYAYANWNTYVLPSTRIAISLSAFSRERMCVGSTFLRFLFVLFSHSPLLCIPPSLFFLLCFLMHSPLSTKFVVATSHRHNSNQKKKKEKKTDLFVVVVVVINLFCSLLWDHLLSPLAVISSKFLLPALTDLPAAANILSRSWTWRRSLPHVSKFSYKICRNECVCVYLCASLHA